MLDMNHLRSTQIKYRAYDDTLRRMMKPLTLEEIFKVNFGNTNLYQLTVMEYTGLKDKHGVEVYEGDIVKANGYNMTPGCQRMYKDIPYRIVTWVDNGWRLCVPSGDTTSGIGLSKGTQHRFEVIGNIFENKDLLGGNHGKN